MYYGPLCHMLEYTAHRLCIMGPCVTCWNILPIDYVLWALVSHVGIYCMGAFSCKIEFLPPKYIKFEFIMNESLRLLLASNATDYS